MTTVNFCAGAFLPMTLPFVTRTVGGIACGIWFVHGPYPLAAGTGFYPSHVDRPDRVSSGGLFAGGFAK